MSSSITHLNNLYENWFLDYASYVILERAVPNIEDGLKPVQRRIMHAMNEMDDGRFNKVANIIGSTMQYHPHGDASIGDAIVNLGQKDLLIDTQGNWGDIRTGDDAAAPRYIEARLSKLAKEIAFNDETTLWKMSYDGRKKEPIYLPLKFPLLIAQGAEGIAVGLSTKILPHNFIEIIQAAISFLKKEHFELYPDFHTGGFIDIKDYKDGERGSKVRIRAKMEILDKKSIVIHEIPFGITTDSLIESIVKANDQGKIKIKKVIDNTAKNVEIVIELMPGTSPEVTMDALYAFTDCEVSVSPNACVINNNKPEFTTISEILKNCTNQTKALLKLELEIKQNQLNQTWHAASLEKIFIENKIYRNIEDCETWEAVLETIDKGLTPFKKLLKREVNQDDIVKLTEIKIKRISKYDAFKADEFIKSIEKDLLQIAKHLSKLTDYTIQYFQNLADKYATGRERKTQIRNFENINITQVAATNQKLYINRAEGFVGFGLKRDEYICDCSDIDDIIVFTKDGKMRVVKIQEKVFVGKEILHAAVFKRNDERTTYNMVYADGNTGMSYVKRFNVSGITRDKEYDITKGNKGSKVMHLSINANGEAEVIQVFLSSACKAKIKQFDFDFSELAVKSRSSIGNQLSKYPLRKITIKSFGISTLGGVDIYLDPSVGRLNTDKRGILLGNFAQNDTIIVFYKNGQVEMTNYDMSNRYELEQILKIEKFDSEKIYTLIHFEGEQNVYLVKRFKIELLTLNKKYFLISENVNSYVYKLFVQDKPSIRLDIAKGKNQVQETIAIQLDEFIDIKGWKAMGNRLSQHNISAIHDTTITEPTQSIQGELF